MGIEWREDLSVGDATIDDQHRQLIINLNDLLGALSKGDGTQAVGQLLDFFEEYIGEHLGYEEEYMRNHGYPGLKAHVEVHRQFEAKYRSFRDEYNKKPTANLAIRMQSFMIDWLQIHIMNEDKKYGEYISGNVNSHPAGEKEDFHEKIQG